MAQPIHSPFPRGLQLSFWAASAVVLAMFRVLSGDVQVLDIVFPVLAWGTIGYGASVILVSMGRRLCVVKRAFYGLLGWGLVGVIGATIAVTVTMTALGTVLGGRMDLRDVAALSLIAASTFAAWSTAALMIGQLQRAHDAELLASSAQHAAADARLRMLRYQLNPHFLFNSLNSLSAAIDEDRDRAQRFLLDLSGLLRDTLADDTDSGTLGDELKRIATYLQIERARFESKLQAHVSVPEDLRNVSCLPMLLQPLVENALKHGEPEEMHVSIRAAREGDGVRIRIANPIGADVGVGTGVGLANVRERLMIRYGHAYRFEQTLRADGWMQVEVGWPCEELR